MADEQEQMSLDKALYILASIHTRDDHEVGFVVVAGAVPDFPLTEFGTGDYIEAWRTVREHLHMPTSA